MNEKYLSSVLLGVYFNENEPNEYIIDGNNYLLEIHNITFMEQYGDTLLNTTGMLKVLFDSNFLILHYEFISKKHIEILQNNEEKDKETKILINQQSKRFNKFGITPALSRLLFIAESISDCLPKSENFIDEFDDFSEIQKSTNQSSKILYYDQQSLDKLEKIQYNNLHKQNTIEYIPNNNFQYSLDFS